MFRYFLSIAMIMFAWSTQAEGAFSELNHKTLKVSDLQDACSVTETMATNDAADALIAGGCIGMVRGIITIMGLNCIRALNDKSSANPLSINPKAGPQTAKTAFIEWARSNPAAANLPAEAGLMRALVDAFPCPSSKEELE